MKCKICEVESRTYARAKVLGKYDATVQCCGSCGFVFLDPVTWLVEAYADAIKPSDVGYVYRNLHAASFVERFLLNSHRPGDFYCDYGAGYGMFVRLMRDKGFRFHWHDPFCENLFASYCDAVPEYFGPYRIVTAIEVFEHLHDPVNDLASITELGSTILFTTELIPEPEPSVKDWWYFGLEHGQHISFYSHRSLEVLAERFDLNYLQLQSNWHLFGSESDISMAKAFLAPPRRFWRAKFRNRLDPPPSLIPDDHDVIVRVVNGSIKIGASEPNNVDWIAAQMRLATKPDLAS